MVKFELEDEICRKYNRKYNEIIRKINRTSRDEVQIDYGKTLSYFKGKQLQKIA